MDSNIKAKIRRGFGANLYGQGTVIFAQILGVPILVRCWGLELYGEWLLLLAIPTYLALTDLGFAQATANDMTRQVQAGNRESAQSEFQTLFALVTIVCSVMLVAALGVAFKLPSAAFSSFSRMSEEEARLVLACVSLEVVSRLFDGVSHAGFRATGGYARHVVLGSTALLVQSIAVWGTAVLGGGPAAAASAYVFVRVLFTGLSATLLMRSVSWLRFGYASASFDEMRRLWRPALANVAFPLAQALNLQGTVILVGTVLTPAIAAVYATTRTMVRLAVQSVFSLANAAEPEMAARYDRHSPELMRNIVLQSAATAWMLACMICVALALAGPALLRVWVGQEVAIDLPFFYALLLAAFVSCVAATPLVALKAANRHLGVMIVFAGLAVANLLLGWAVVRGWPKLVGVGLIGFVSELLFLAYLIPRCSRLLQISARMYLRHLFSVGPLLATRSNKRLSKYPGPDGGEAAGSTECTNRSEHA